MKTALLKSAVVGATIALLASLAYMLFAPRDFLGWSPVGILAETVFWPGVKVGEYVGEHWTQSAEGGWTAGILAMTLIGAILGWLVGWASCFLRHKPN